MTSREPIRRVLQVHTRYREAGGEDRVVEDERKLLEGAGVDVAQLIFDNAGIRDGASRIGDLRIAADTVWSRGAAATVRRELAHHRAQIMHVHNTFAAASPAVIQAAASIGVPVVQTLHNYRLFCPAGTAFRNGHVCTDCLGRGIPWPGIIHRCYRDSILETAVAATSLVAHRALHTYTRDIRVYLALTPFQRNLMVEAGLPAARVRVLSNFLEPDPGSGNDARNGMMFIGRLSVEKGIQTLLAAARITPGLIRIAGTGVYSATVDAAAADGDVRSLGWLEAPKVLSELGRATSLVLPSLWFEAFPLVVLEAYATATPVIASRIGSLAEIVEDGVTGLLFEPGDAAGLAERMRWATEHPAEMRALGLAARERYETRYRGAGHLLGLLAAYAAAQEACTTNA